MRTRWARAVGGFAVVGAAVAGCAGSPGAAAIVDGTPITEATLAETVADLSVFADVAPVETLEALIVAPFWLDAAAEAGLGASAQDGRALLDSLAERQGVEPPAAGYGPGALTIAQFSAVQQKALEAEAAQPGQAQALGARADELIRESEITVSPRYGGWAGAGGIAPVERAWLIGPVGS